MPDNQSLNLLFAKGLTIEQFLDKYAELKKEETNNEDSSSIFKTDGDAAVVALYNSVDTDHDGKLSESEINVLKGLDTTDGEQTLSEKDIDKLLEQTLKKMNYADGNTSPEDMYKKAVTENGLQEFAQDGESAHETYTRILGNQLETLEQLIEMRENSSTMKIERFQNQLNTLIINRSNLSAEEKSTYAKNVSDLKTLKTRLGQKQKEYKEQNYELEMDKAEVEYLQSKPDKSDNNDKIEKLKNKISGLTASCRALQNEISQITSQISSITTAQNALIKKAESRDASFKEDKERILNEIDTERKTCKEDIDGYRSRISTLESAQSYALSQAESTYTDDGDYTAFEGDGKALMDLWKQKWTKDLGGASKADAKIKELGGQDFFNKVCAVANNIGCNANELMGVMNAESGVTTNAKNKNSSATGLIQFMKDTASDLGTTTSALKQMSAVQQLDYVEKFYKYTKKIGGFKSNDKIDAGTLYALTFMPAYAKREVLTADGQKAYKYNKGIDLDKDGKITKSDLARRVRQKMA